MQPPPKVWVFPWASLSRKDHTRCLDKSLSRAGRHRSRSQLQPLKGRVGGVRGGGWTRSYSKHLPAGRKLSSAPNGWWGCLKKLCIYLTCPKRILSNTAVPQWKGSRSWKGKQESLVDGFVKASALSAFLPVNPLIPHWRRNTRDNQLEGRYTCCCSGASFTPSFMWDTKEKGGGGK